MERSKIYQQDQKSLTKLAPYRYITTGYTGQKNNADRHYMTYSSDTVQKESEKLDKLALNIMALDAREMTQFLRGRLYVLADFLLETDYTGKEEEIPKVVTLLKKILNFTIIYMKQYPSMIPYEAEGLKYRNLYLADKRVAFALALKDIVDVQSIYFNCHRVIKFYGVNI
jgi:hypothetical protein